MDISYYFGPKGKYTKTNSPTHSEETKENINHKRKQRQKYVGLLSKLVSNQYIDMLEYTHLLNFLKSGGTFVNLGRYNQIMEKIEELLNDPEADIDLINKYKFINSSKETYTHIYDVMDNTKGSIDINKFIKNLQKNSTTSNEIDNKDITFTDDQTEGIKNICNFLCDQNTYCYGLYGYAGTGKTTLITKLLHHLLAKNYINSVVFAAPTNKAVNIIKSKFRNDLDDLMKLKFGENHSNVTDSMNLDEQLDLLERKGFKINFLTIHKLLNYKNDFDHNGERIFVKGNKSTINNYDLIIIDECSMIPFQIIVHIFEEIRSQITSSVKDNIVKQVPKVLFVGDPAQLPPVNEKVSVIFSKNKREFDINLFKQATMMNEVNCFEDTNKNVNDRFKALVSNILEMESTVLRKIVRCNDDMVIGLCNEIRSWVIGTTKQPRIGSFKGVKVSIYKYKKEGKTNTRWFKKCARYFKDTHNNQHMSNIILTWTNKQADDYNTRIRQILFNKEVLEQFEIGDILILNDFYNIKESSADIEVSNNKGKEKVKSSKRFYTSEQIKVTDIEQVTRCSPELSTMLPGKLRRMENYAIIEDRFRKTVQLINRKTIRKYEVWKLYVHRLTDTIIKDNIPDVYSIYVVKDISVDQLEEDRQFAAEKIRDLRNYYGGVFKDQINKIDIEIIKPLWREWNKAFCEPFADVNCGACITTHKSQSSTFYNVFVDANDILNNNNMNEAKRCIYTALTRVSNELHILI